MTLSRPLTIAALLAFTTLSVSEAGGLHVRKAKSRCCIPAGERYRYNESPPAATASVVSEVAVAATTQQALPDETHVTRRVVTTQNAGGTSTQTIETRTTSVPTRQNVRQRRFVLNDLQSGPITQQGAGARLDERGRLVFSSTLTHTGGDAKALKGGLAVIRVAALASPSNDSTSSAVILWKTRQKRWLRTGIPTPLTIVADDQDLKNRYFDQVTYIQVWVEYLSHR